MGWENVMSALMTARACHAALLATLLAARGLKKKSLSRSGAAAAWVVGFASFLTSYRFGVTLILFYQSSSSLTKLKQDVKKKFEMDYKEGGQRDYNQVLSCSLVATVLALVYLYCEGEDAPVNWANAPRRSFLLCAYLGHYACCNGDTWASELGVLNTRRPFLCLPPFREVPVGTNGGISLLGTAASLGAGVFIGLGFALLGIAAEQGHFQIGYVLLGAAAGLGGSMLDSAMGATLQATYYDTEKKCICSPLTKNGKHICGWDILTNEQVNAISVAVVTYLSGWAGKFFF